MKSFAKILTVTICTLLLFSCASAPKNEGKEKADDGSMTEAELSYIKDTAARHLLQNDVEKDNEILRKVSIPAKLGAEGYDVLEKFMLESLGTGVGIAAPQVGINRRVIMVQRFDKEEKPFEFYYNIEIKKTYGEKVVGWEGCLSIPAGFGQVERWQDIDIEYDTEVDGKIVRKSENIKGFTAVIFQHETDHLNGILFIDIKTADPLMDKDSYREMRMKEKAEKEAKEQNNE